jgi:hypothetical protein
VRLRRARILAVLVLRSGAAAFLAGAAGLAFLLTRAVLSAYARLGARDGLVSAVAGGAAADLFEGVMCMLFSFGGKLPRS